MNSKPNQVKLFQVTRFSVDRPGGAVLVDGSFPRLVKKCWSIVPDWFKEALPSSSGGLVRAVVI